MHEIEKRIARIKRAIVHRVIESGKVPDRVVVSQRFFDDYEEHLSAVDRWVDPNRSYPNLLFWHSSYKSWDGPYLEIHHA